MKFLVRIIFFGYLLVCSLTGLAQQKSPAQFGDITEKDFNPKQYNVDTNSAGVVIADIGSSKIEGNNKGWFSLLYKHYKRIHILNKNGYDLANVAVQLYSDGRDEEKLDKVRAVTYNFENGKVVQTKLDSKEIFKDKIGKNTVIRKFTFPNIKEGSIVEFEYNIVSDFLFNLQPWQFQGSYPCLWSEYNLSLPDFFSYLFITQGSVAFDVQDRKNRRQLFMVGDPKSSYKDDASDIEVNVSDYRWVQKNVSALKDESYMYTPGNYVSKIEFQLAEQLEPLQPQKFMAGWEQFSKEMMGSASFGLPLTADNYWLKGIVDPLVNNTSSEKERAEKIFAWVRDHFTCTDYNSVEMDQGLRNLVKTHSGNVAEINLLLTAMLRYTGIGADPVILSTRSNGYASNVYPIMHQYNYVIVRTGLNGRYYFLDASEPRLGFGSLPLRCYNNYARIINEKATSVELKSDQVTETKYTTVFIFTDDQGKLAGTMQQVPGYYESLGLRNMIKEKGQEELEKDVQKAFSPAVEISNFRLDSLDAYEQSLGIRYDFEIKGEKQDIIYLDPFFGEAYRDNPFKSARRLYPIEMPTARDETYTLQLEVPKGYVVDGLPGSLKLKLNEQSEGIFEYRLSQSGNTLSFYSHLRISRTYFKPEEYEMLREFFSQVIKKQAEQIVFKKK